MPGRITRGTGASTRTLRTPTNTSHTSRPTQVIPRLTTTQVRCVELEIRRRITRHTCRIDSAARTASHGRRTGDTRSTTLVVGGGAAAFAGGVDDEGGLAGQADGVAAAGQAARHR